MKLCLMRSVLKLPVFEETVADWVAKLPSVIKGYDSKDTLNGDETGLIFLAIQNDKCWQFSSVVLSQEKFKNLWLLEKQLNHNVLRMLTSINFLYSRDLTRVPRLCLISWKTGWEHLNEQSHHIPWFLDVTPAFLTMNCLIFSLWGSHQMPQVNLNLYKLHAAELLSTPYVITAGQQRSRLRCYWTCKVHTSPWCSNLHSWGVKAVVSTNSTKVFSESSTVH